MQKRGVALLVVVLLAAGAVAYAAANRLTADIDDSKCRARAREVIQVAERLERHKREHGAYPVAHDWATLNVSFGYDALSIHTSLGDPGLFYASTSDGYQFAYFPNGAGQLGGPCSCFVVQDRHFVGFPPALSPKSVARLQDSLESTLRPTGGAP